MRPPLSGCCGRFASCHRSMLLFGCFEHVNGSGSGSGAGPGVSTGLPIAHAVRCRPWERDPPIRANASRAGAIGPRAALPGAGLPRGGRPVHAREGARGACSAAQRRDDHVIDDILTRRGSHGRPPSRNSLVCAHPCSPSPTTCNSQRTTSTSRQLQNGCIRRRICDQWGECLDMAGDDNSAYLWRRRCVGAP